MRAKKGESVRLYENHFLQVNLNNSEYCRFKISFEIDIFLVICKCAHVKVKRKKYRQIHFPLAFYSTRYLVAIIFCTCLLVFFSVSSRSFCIHNTCIPPGLYDSLYHSYRNFTYSIFFSLYYFFFIFFLSFSNVYD